MNELFKNTHTEGNLQDIFGCCAGLEIWKSYLEDDNVRVRSLQCAVIIRRYDMIIRYDLPRVWTTLQHHISSNTKILFHKETTF